MKLTVIQEINNELFLKEDFKNINNLFSIEFIYDNGEEINIDSTKKIPADTTHLLLDAVIVLDKNELLRLKKLEYIGTTYTGWWDKYFDVEEIRKRDIKLVINKGYATNAVAEATFTVLLSNARKNNNMEQSENNDFELKEKKLLILGKGEIAKRIDEIAAGFKIETSFFDTRKDNIESLNYSIDLVSVNVPKSAGEIINEEILSKLKNTKLIVNSSGWDNVDEAALYQFLKKNKKTVYIHIAYPDKGKEEIFQNIENVKFYPLFSNKTKESSLERKMAPLRELSGDFNKR